MELEELPLEGTELAGLQDGVAAQGDDDRAAGAACLGDSRGEHVGENHTSTAAMIAFWVCRRFSTCSKTTELGE